MELLCMDNKLRHKDCLQKMKTNNIDWGIYIDMDEYIFLNNDKGDLKVYLDSLKENVSAIRLQQIEFLSRFKIHIN